jgi:hypothetical protein
MSGEGMGGSLWITFWEEFAGVAMQGSASTTPLPA